MKLFERCSSRYVTEPPGTQFIVECDLPAAHEGNHHGIGMRYFLPFEATWTQEQALRAKITGGPPVE
jgi:hypothetical protein